MKAHALAALLAALAIPAADAAIDLQYNGPGRSIAYRKVLIAPVEVRFHRDFEASHGTLRGPGDRLRPEEARKLAEDMGESLRVALVEALQARGFQVASAPGADVLRLAPSIRDLHVNAPERTRPGLRHQYVREAGQAVLEIDARDPAGAPVFRGSEQRTTPRTEPFTRATDVSNRFWFDAMFRRYAEDLAVALAPAR